MCFFKNKNLSKQYRNKESGFSLLELGVVLGIVGLLVAGSISVFSEQKTHAQWQESDLKLQLVKKSLINYVALNKFLLCPDDSGDGFEDRKSDGTCRVNEGKVPFLNLTKSGYPIWCNANIFSLFTGRPKLLSCPICSFCSSC